jgi:hypothetical protein
LVALILRINGCLNHSVGARPGEDDFGIDR